MRSFLLLAFIAFVCFPQSVFSHTYLSSVVINGEKLVEGDCVRPHPALAYDYPIPLVTSPDMTCGWLPSAAQPANRKCGISAGSSIGIQWHHSSTDPSDDIIAATHLGPCLVYLARSDDGAGPVWFKIFEQGFSNGAWCVSNLIANKGLLTVTIPSDIAPGNYLLRGEIIALHGANVLNGVQPYVGCVELTISGSGTAKPAGVAIPGAYSASDPGMLFNLYNVFTSYIIPGPAVYKANSSPSSPTTKPTVKPTTAPVNPTTPPVNLLLLPPTPPAPPLNLLLLLLNPPQLPL